MTRYCASRALLSYIVKFYALITLLICSRNNAWNALSTRFVTVGTNSHTLLRLRALISLKLDAFSSQVSLVS